MVMKMVVSLELCFNVLQDFLDSELNNNAEREKKVSTSERNSAKLRLQYQDAENARVRFQDEVDCAKKNDQV